MDFDGGTLRDVLGTIALLALLSVAFGSVMRACRRPWLGRTVLGLAFGGASVLAMFDPLVIAPGLIMDMRHVPIILAGAFLGPEGTLVAAALAVAMRLEIGGMGAPAGTVSLILSALAGLVWARWSRGKPRNLLAMVVLAGLPSIHWLATFLLPLDVARHFLARAVPYFGPLEFAGTLALAILFERERRHLEERKTLRREAYRDGLTGLLNRRGFEKEVALLGGQAAGTLLLLDLDHFKDVNDRHGHPGGDAVLRALGLRLAPLLKSGQLLARLGGEELAVFLPGQTAQVARDVARRICAAVRSRPFALPGGDSVSITVSVGGAWGGPARLDMLMARADAALYAAKHAGRDRCRFASEGPVSTSPREQERASQGACAGCHLQDRCADEGRAEPRVRAVQARSA